MINKSTLLVGLMIGFLGASFVYAENAGSEESGDVAESSVGSGLPEGASAYGGAPMEEGEVSVASSLDGVEEGVAYSGAVAESRSAASSAEESDFEGMVADRGRSEEHLIKQKLSQ